MKLIPSLNHLVVKQIKQSGRSGIIITTLDAEKEKSQQVVITELAKWYNDIVGKEIVHNYKVGDTILIIKHAGIEFKDETQTEEIKDVYDQIIKQPITYTIIEYDDILCKLE